MSNGTLERFQAPGAPARVGQATYVEQSRAVAEVQAMVIVAQQMPRNVDEAVREMQRSCSRKSVAEKAFYRYKRGSSQVTGESIVLAKELARCWGNIDYGLAELRRDDIAGESEMMAFAWDLQKNTRPRTTFIVPHVRDGGGRLTGVRDIYENNANMGARRMREMILNLMPPWFVDDAKELCYATMAADKSDGETIAERAAKAVGRFSGIGVSVAQLTQKLGAPQAAWSAADLATLGVIFKSIERGETTKEDEFGTAASGITVADLAPKSPSPAGTETPAPPPPAGEAKTAADYIADRLAALGVELKVQTTARIVGRVLPSLEDLSPAEATAVMRALRDCKDAADLDGLLAEIEMAGDPRGEEGGNGGE